jgi:hypothetical protein
MVEMDTYKNVRSRLRTGDIVFFKDVGVSSMISCLQTMTSDYGEYTHVGIVIMSDSFPVGSQYRLCGVDGVDYATIPYVFESTQSGIGGDGSIGADGRKMLGVQLRKLDDVVLSYGTKPKTKIVIGKLKDEYVIDDEKLYESFVKYNHTRYQLNIVQLLSGVFKILRKIRCICNIGIFCSELVALMLIENGILSDKVNPKNCLPVNFVPKNDKETYGNDCEIPVLLSKLIEIKTTKIQKQKQVNCFGI